MQTDSPATLGDLKRLVRVSNEWASEVAKSRPYLDLAKANLSCVLEEQDELRRDRDSALQMVCELKLESGCNEEISWLLSMADALNDLLSEYKIAEAIARVKEAEGAIAYARLYADDYSCWLYEILDEYQQGLVTDEECLRRLAADESWEEYDDDDDWMANPAVELVEVWRLFRLWCDRSKHALLVNPDGSGLVRVIEAVGDRSKDKLLIEWTSLNEAIQKLQELLSIKMTGAV